MSIAIMSAVWSNSPFDGGALLVLLALSDWANDDGICWPSQKALSAKSRLSRATVQRHLLTLEKAGSIKRAGTSAHGTILWQVVPPSLKMRHGGVPQNEAGGASRVRQGGASPHEAQTTIRTTKKKPTVSPAATKAPRSLLVKAQGVWEKHTGGVLHWGRLATNLKLLAAKPEGEVLAALDAYLGQTEVKYVSPERWVATYGKWTAEAPKHDAEEIGEDDLTL